MQKIPENHSDLCHVFQKQCLSGGAGISVYLQKKGTGLYREKDGFLIPYVQIQLTDKLLPIKEIVVAPKNHIDLAKKGMEYMIAEKAMMRRYPFQYQFKILRERIIVIDGHCFHCSDAEK